MHSSGPDGHRAAPIWLVFLSFCFVIVGDVFSAKITFNEPWLSADNNLLKRVALSETAGAPGKRFWSSIPGASTCRREGRHPMVRVRRKSQEIIRR